jgi:hypothetical protein
LHPTVTRHLPQEWMRLQAEKLAEADRKRLNARRLAMIREDEHSAKAEAKYRAWLEEQRQARAAAKERDARARERMHMTEAARDCRCAAPGRGRTCMCSFMAYAGGYLRL